MSRRKSHQKREMIPDPIHNDVVGGQVCQSDYEGWEKVDCTEDFFMMLLRN